MGGVKEFAIREDGEGVVDGVCYVNFYFQNQLIYLKRLMLLFAHVLDYSNYSKKLMYVSGLLTADTKDEQETKKMKKKTTT